jgi:hypothetical protein
VGRLRVHAHFVAAAAVIAPIWVRYLSTYPEVHLEIAVGDAPIDIVAKGFDAGIGPRDRVPVDMIAVRVMGPMKIAVVGAPTYFARRRPPRTPDDLVRHSCVQFRIAGDGKAFAWRFERNRKSPQISVEGRVNNAYLAVRAAVDGLGIAYTLEDLAEPFLRSGQLMRVLEEWSPTIEDCSSIIPDTGKSQPRCGPSSTWSAQPAARHRPSAPSRTPLPRTDPVPWVARARIGIVDAAVAQDVHSASGDLALLDLNSVPGARQNRSPRRPIADSLHDDPNNRCALSFDDAIGDRLAVGERDETDVTSR